MEGFRDENMRLILQIEDQLEYDRFDMRLHLPRMTREDYFTRRFLSCPFCISRSLEIVHGNYFSIQSPWYTGTGLVAMLWYNTWQLKVPFFNSYQASRQYTLSLLAVHSIAPFFSSLFFFGFVGNVVWKHLKSAGKNAPSLSFRMIYAAIWRERGRALFSRDHK